MQFEIHLQLPLHYTASGIYICTTQNVLNIFFLPAQSLHRMIAGYVGFLFA